VDIFIIREYIRPCENWAVSVAVWEIIIIRVIHLSLDRPTFSIYPSVVSEGGGGRICGQSFETFLGLKENGKNIKILGLSIYYILFVS
jgi:hypothetical protein